MVLSTNNINVIFPTGGTTDYKTPLLTTATRPPPTTAPPPSDPGIIAGINPLDVAAATYGKVIPIVVGGCPRIGGYIIYGPKFTTVAGLSYVSFGVSFGLQADPDGERELWEIRMDGVKVWTIEDGALIDGLTFRFTEGTEVQEPDAMLVTDYGDAAPAFRSQCCIFFQTLAIARFDNHVPFVSAVLADVTDGADPSDGILLGDALERLASSAYVGLDSDRFETTGITTIVLGLIEAERGSFIDLLQRLARLFPLDVVQTDKLRVIERSSIAPDIVLNTNRIVGGLGAVQIQRQTETDVAQELEFIYIDIDRDYEFTPQKARRPSDPVAITASRAKETINLPIVTTASNAISWVTLRKYWDEVARTSVSFTAMPYGMEIDPGTMVAVKLDLSTYVIRVSETSHEARGTVKCVGTPVLRCSVSVIDDGPEIGDEEEDGIPVLIAVGAENSGVDPQIQSSTGGVVWTAETSVPASDAFWVGVGDLGGSLFIAVGGSSGPSLISTSPDGSSWTSHTILDPTNGDFSAVDCSGALCVAVGEDNDSGAPAIVTSPDGAAWTRRTTAFTGGTLHGVCFGGGLYLAVGVDGGATIAATSANATSWTVQVPTPSSIAAFDAVASNGALFVVVGQDQFTNEALITTTPDGVSWTIRTTPAISDSRLFGIHFADGIFVAVGKTNGDAFILTSSSGTSWSAATISGAGIALYGISFSNGLWVAVGEDTGLSESRIFTSPDAVTWTARTPASSAGPLYAVFGRS